MLEFAGKIQEGSQKGIGEEPDSACMAAYEAVLSIFHIAKYRDYFHGNLRLLGLPGSNGEYHALIPEVKIGIASAGSQKDGAWEFVRTLLSEEHQKSCSMLPVHKGAFDAVMQAAMEGKSVWAWIYENGSAAANDNQALENIILEEAGEYFSGAMNVKEAAETIQSRATLYINEQM